MVKNKLEMFKNGDDQIKNFFHIYDNLRVQLYGNSFILKMVKTIFASSTNQ